METIDDRLEVKVASCGPARGPNLCDDLAHPHRLALRDADCLEVVVRGDQAVAMLDFNPVATAPHMPSHSPHHAGVRGVDPRTAGGCIVLAPVELSCQARQGAVAVAVGRALIEDLKR